MKPFHKVLKAVYGYRIKDKWYNKIIIEYRSEDGTETEEREYITDSTVSRVKMMQEVRLYV